MTATWAFIVGVIVGIILTLGGLFLLAMHFVRKDEQELLCWPDERRSHGEKMYRSRVTRNCLIIGTVGAVLVGMAVGAFVSLEVALVFYLPLASVAAFLAVIEQRRYDALFERARAAICAEGKSIDPIARAA
jgi:Na+/glutamate symporter